MGLSLHRLIMVYVYLEETWDHHTHTHTNHCNVAKKEI